MSIMSILSSLSIALALVSALVFGVFLFYVSARVITRSDNESEEYTSAPPNESWSSTAARACEIQMANKKGSTPNIESWIDWIEEKLIQ